MLQIGMSDRSPARPEVDHQPSAHRHSLRGEGACFGLSRRSVDGRCLSSQSGVSPMIKSIPLAKLVQSPRNVRRHGDPAADSELKASIAAHGLLQNLIVRPAARGKFRSEEHTSELQSLMRSSYAVFRLKKKTKHKHTN